MRALPGRAARAVLVAAVVAVGALALASCSDDGLASEAVQSASSLAADVSAPDVSAPDVSAPDVSLPDVSAPDVTAPQTTAPAATPAAGDAPAEAAPADTSGGSDEGLGPFGIGLLVLLAMVIIAVIVTLVRGGGSSSGDDAQRRHRLYLMVDRLIEDGNWAIRQAFETTRSTDLDRVVNAWPSAREHFLDIERTAADIHPDSPELLDSIQMVGLAVAELRGSLDAYADAIRRGSLGELDALGPLQVRVTGRQDHLAVQLQALSTSL